MQVKADWIHRLALDIFQAHELVFVRPSEAVHRLLKDQRPLLGADALCKVSVDGADHSVLRAVQPAAAYPVALIIDRYAAVGVLPDRSPARFFVRFVAVKLAVYRPFLLLRHLEPPRTHPLRGATRRPCPSENLLSEVYAPRAAPLCA